MIRRILIMIALLVTLAGCQRPSFSGVFAFVDDKGFASIYDLSKQEVIWKSQFESPRDSTPSWSPGGDYLIHQYLDESGAEYVRILDVASMSSRSVVLSSRGMLDVGPLHWVWSPTGKYVALISPGYPVFEVRIVSIEDAETVCRFVSSSRPIWNPDEKSLCYSAWIGVSDITAAYQKLIVVDLETGSQTAVFEGRTGQSLTPVGWTEDGAPIYRCSSESGDCVKDTRGTEYPNSGEYRKYYASTPYPERPPEAMYQNMKVVGWSKNAKGEWLISRANEGEPLQIAVFMQGDERCFPVVKGRAPAWRP